MRNSLKLEELVGFCFGIYLFSQTDFEWWWFLVFILTPDIAALGYVFGNKVGAFVYNFFHHKALALLVLGLGWKLNFDLLELAGIILFAHSCLDRFFGYGLKYATGFKDTHLGKVP